VRALLLVALALALPACRAYGALAWRTTGDARLIEATRTVRVPFTCPRAAAWVAATVDIDLQDGALAFVVRDPSGTERVNAAAEPQARARELEFAALPGEWVAELALDRFSGSYRVTWRSGPAATSAPGR
jgi:hypothetical protein